MKTCPSCGAELGERDYRCPICDFILPVAESPENKAGTPDKEVSGLLDDVKAKLQKIAGTGSDEEATESVLSESASEEAESVAAEEAEEEAAKADALQEGSLTITSRPVYGDVKLPGMPSEEKKLEKEPDKIGYKIRAEFANKKGGRRLIVVISIIVALMMIMTYWFFILPNQSSITPVIDGLFGDWSKAVKYESYIKSDNSGIDFKECAVQLSGGSLFWYFSTNGALFNVSSNTSPLISTYSLFIDADGKATTGFSLFKDFGADDVVVIAGSSGKNSSMTKIYEFYGPDRNNWSSWRILDKIIVGSMGKQVETSFVTPSTFNSTYARYMAFSYDGVSSPSATLPFSLAPGILLIKQTSLVSDNDIIWSGINRPILKATLTGYGEALPVAYVRPTVTGISETYNLGSINWNESQMKVGRDLLFSVNTTYVKPGELITATILPSDVVSDYGSVVVIGDIVRGYIGSIPNGITIDGIFSDWHNLEDDSNDAPIPYNIDIDRIGNSTGPYKSDFYIEVKGKMFNGALIPMGELAPSPTMSSNPWSTERVTGEDVLKIFFDTDPGAAKGAPSPFNGTDLRPDLMVEICGRNGLITEKIIKSWNNGWEETLIGMKIDIVGNKMEMEIPSMNLSNAKYAIVFTDWIGDKDNITGSI